MLQDKYRPLSSSSRTRHLITSSRSQPFGTTTVMLRAALYYIMSQELYLNIPDPQYARYIDLRHDLQEYLEGMYGSDIDFGITHQSDRWSFYGPDKLNKKEIRQFTRAVLRRRQSTSASTSHSSS
ncbi:hypothetical protein V2W45_1415574 [Cenococcum geophilum]